MATIVFPDFSKELESLKKKYTELIVSKDLFFGALSKKANFNFMRNKTNFQEWNYCDSVAGTLPEGFCVEITGEYSQVKSYKRLKVYFFFRSDGKITLIFDNDGDGVESQKADKFKLVSPDFIIENVQEIKNFLINAR